MQYAVLRTKQRYFAKDLYSIGLALRTCPPCLPLLQYDDEVRRITEPDTSSGAEVADAADDTCSEGFESAPRSCSSEADDADAAVEGDEATGVAAPLVEDDSRFFLGGSEPTCAAEAEVTEVRALACVMCVGAGIRFRP